MLRGSPILASLECAAAGIGDAETRKIFHRFREATDGTPGSLFRQSAARLNLWEQLPSRSSAFSERPAHPTTRRRCGVGCCDLFELILFALRQLHKNQNRSGCHSCVLIHTFPCTFESHLGLNLNFANRVY